MKRLRKTLECIGVNLADDFQEVLIDLDKKILEEEKAYASKWLDGRGNYMVNRISSASEYRRWCRRQLAYGYSDEFSSEDWDDFINDFDAGVSRSERKRKKKRKRGSKKRKGRMKSQKFIEDREVSDNEFDDYNEYGYLEEDDNPTDCYHSPKDIYVYRSLDDMLDFDKFTSVYEFDEWCNTWDYEVTVETINNCLWYDEIHCFICNNCVISARSYGDLVYEVTGGDYELIAKYSNIN